MNDPKIEAVRGQDRDERGFAAMALVVILVPLLFLVGSYLQTMAGRNSRLQLEIKEERAILVAESGLDVALYEARRGTLAAGHLAEFTFTGTLRSGGGYRTVCTYLGDDDRDNDGDGNVDEPDEDVFRVITDGQLATSQRRIAAYLGYSPFLTSPQSAIAVMNQNPNIRLSGTSVVDGRNYTIGGALAGSGDTYGMTIAPPATTANLLATMAPSEQTQVVGSTASPSLATSTTYTPTELAELVAQARNSAQIVITNAMVASATYGTPGGTEYITYREGDLRFAGNVSGAGLLVVNGSLTITGTMTWYGVVVVTGNIACGTGTATVYGSMIIGNSDLDLRGTVDLRYSEQAIGLAQRLTGRYVAFNGWQEIGLGATP